VPSLSTVHTAESILRPSEKDAQTAWQDLAKANSEQIARLCRTLPPDDYWDPNRRDSPIHVVNLEQVPDFLQAVRDLAERDDVWLDIGAGVGRHAIYLSQFVRQVLTFDPSLDMTTRMKGNVKTFKADNVQVLPVDGWPSTAPQKKDVDVCLAVHVVYFVEDIGAFLDAMENHARRLCVVVANERGTGWQPLEPLFDQIHGERYIRQPALPELLAVLGARRRPFNVQTFGYGSPESEDIDSAHQRLREDHLVELGTASDAILWEAVLNTFGVNQEHVRVPSPLGNRVSVVSWRPPAG
jgi:SAM-dependent methyltransferase